MASSEADEIGASVAPDNNNYSRVRVDGANALINSRKKTWLTCVGLGLSERVCYLIVGKKPKRVLLHTSSRIRNYVY